MAAALTLVDSEGRFIRIELTAHDVLHLCRDAQKLLGATAAEVSAWWHELTGWTQEDADGASGVEIPTEMMPTRPRPAVRRESGRHDGPALRIHRVAGVDRRRRW